MSVTLTPEQQAVLEAQGRVIVSASAGSGKTFVMIEKLIALLEQGVPVTDILAVTFTNKAAAQMKEKLRKKLVERMATANEEKRKLLKMQLSEVQSANVSTIHALCAKLLRTYFYCLDFDGSFDILSDDDAVAVDLKKRALDEVFDTFYTENTPAFQLLLECLRRKRSDENLRALILKSYNAVRNTVGYRQKLQDMKGMYTEEGFQKVCEGFHAEVAERATFLRDSLTAFYQDFHVQNKEVYDKRFEEMFFALDEAIANPDIFAEHPVLCGKKPTDKDADKAEGARYKAFVDELKEQYNKLFEGLHSREEEREYFLKSGDLVAAYCDLLLAFEEAYAALKREEGKLDYTDLEHYTLALLENKTVLEEVQEKFRYVYVDEYQDVNPVQEAILSAIGGENVFLVGDVKQAIYGFRGSKSVFFSHKFDLWESGKGQALKLTSNFRSADGVVNFVNDLFSYAMRKDTCGIDYANTSRMVRGAPYPDGSGATYVYVYGKEEEKLPPEGVYSVKAHADELPEASQEGLAIVKVVKECLKRTYYDLSTGEEKPITAGDICILTRKKEHESVVGIIRALQQAGIPVSGMGSDDILETPEVKTMLDILSYIDNAEQDIPLVSAMLSPLGSFTEDELARIRVSCLNVKDKAGKPLSYRACCAQYAARANNILSQKLNEFFTKMNGYRELSEVFGASSLIHKILADTCWEVSLARGDGKRLQNVRRLAEQARTATGELFLADFLAEIRALRQIPASDSSLTDSVKIMTMHASKGLEFPVVILADICRTFRGQDYEEIPFDEEYGFTPKYYDLNTNIMHETILRRLAKRRADKEDTKNELNLYYVACTRAMAELHIFAAEVKPYSPVAAIGAKSYAEFTDLERYSPIYLNGDEEEEEAQDDVLYISEPDEKLLADVKACFHKPYAFADRVDLPVKSSASALLRMQDTAYAATAHTLFEEESEEAPAVGTDVGKAYHRYLELCDLSENRVEKIAAQKQEMLRQNLISQEQFDILSDEKLAQILAMDVFQKVKGAQIYREQEFLCRLPANEFLPTSATDGVMVQGAIDLLILGKAGCHIVDYKYSKRSDAELVAAYAKQLDLYKKAVAVVLKVDAATIRTTLVNIRSIRAIPLE